MHYLGLILGSSQGSKQVPPSHLGQLDFPFWQVLVTFYSHLPNGQGIRQVIRQLNHLSLKIKLTLAQDLQKFRAT